MARRTLWAALALLLLVSCQREREPVELLPAEGPSTFQTDVALQHAAQFEGDQLGERLAGSQQEQGAAVYILGVLQRNGYIVRLDAVPVRNLVTSTNVIASAPEQGSPEAVVVVPYDSPPGSKGEGEALGLFLELSRAVNVASSGHGVWFAALGAEHAQESSGALGARRLAAFLLDQDADPLVVRLLDVEPAGGLRVGGGGAERLRTLVSPEPPEAPAPPRDAFAEAGLEVAVVSGGIEEIGRFLLRYLGRTED